MSKLKNVNFCVYFPVYSAITIASTKALSQTQYMAFVRFYEEIAHCLFSFLGYKKCSNADVYAFSNSDIKMILLFNNAITNTCCMRPWRDADSLVFLIKDVLLLYIYIYGYIPRCYDRCLLLYLPSLPQYHHQSIVFISRFNILQHLIGTKAVVGAYKPLRLFPIPSIGPNQVAGPYVQI